MAGRGPAPKASDQRRRRNAPERGEWVELPETLDKPVLPARLPRRAKGEGPWSERTKRLYAGWRQDPVTATYGANEIAQVIELAYMQERLMGGDNGGTPYGAAEIRQRMDGLGLTPKGKRDLRFGQGVMRRGQQQQRGGSSRKTKGGSRTRLRAVA